MKKIKIFLNLTNGIEALELHNLSPEDVSFIRIQSSHCESHQYETILNECDHNFLLYLALGYHCIVYDFGARAESPKALHTGMEWIKYVLYRRWFGRDYTPVIKGKNVSDYFLEQYRAITYKTKQRLDYYKKLLATEEIYLETVPGNTTHDNNMEYYKEILHEKFV